VPGKKNSETKDAPLVRNRKKSSAPPARPSQKGNKTVLPPEAMPPRAKGRKKDLVIVESPAKSRTLNKFLGRGYAVLASNGHVMDLPKSELGVDLDEHIAFVINALEGIAPNLGLAGSTA